MASSAENRTLKRRDSPWVQQFAATREDAQRVFRVDEDVPAHHGIELPLRRERTYVRLDAGNVA